MCDDDVPAPNRTCLAQRAQDLNLGGEPGHTDSLSPEGKSVQHAVAELCSSQRSSEWLRIDRQRWLGRHQLQSIAVIADAELVWLTAASRV